MSTGTALAPAAPRRRAQRGRARAARRLAAPGAAAESARCCASALGRRARPGRARGGRRDRHSWCGGAAQGARTAPERRHRMRRRPPAASARPAAGRVRARALGVDGDAVDAEEHGLPARALAERVGQALAHELDLAQAQRALRGAVGRAVGGRVRVREVVQLLRPVAQRPPQAEGAVVQHHLHGRRPRVGDLAPAERLRGASALRQRRRGPGGVPLAPLDRTCASSRRETESGEALMQHRSALQCPWLHERAAPRAVCASRRPGRRRGPARSRWSGWWRGRSCQT
jgi:hypothetical protein